MERELVSAAFNRERVSAERFIVTRIQYEQHVHFVHGDGVIRRHWKGEISR